MTYKVDLSFDPPMETDDAENFDYVHMTLESDSRKCLEWLMEVILTSSDKDIRSSLFMYYPVEEILTPAPLPAKKGSQE